MRKRRPGTRLALALPEDWPRWISMALYLIFGSAFVAPTIWFLLDPTYTTFGLFEVLAAILGVIFVVAFVHLFVLAILTGYTAVEISREPALIDHPLEYSILQGRPSPHVRSFEATLKLRRHRGRSWEIALTVPLAPATVDADGRRRIEGSIVMPEIPDGSPMFSRGLEWFIEIRVTFIGGHVHEEEHPFAVERVIF